MKMSVKILVTGPKFCHFYRLFFYLSDIRHGYCFCHALTLFVTGGGIDTRCVGVAIAFLVEFRDGTLILPLYI